MTRRTVILALILAVACGPAVPAAGPAVPAAGPAAGPARPFGLPSAAARPVARPTSPPALGRPGDRTAPGAVLITRAPPAARGVLLTFDAGADTGFALQILDTLAAAGVSATFGVTGRWAEANPDLVRRIVRDGHSVINHTYDHRSFTGVATRTAPLSPDERRAEIDRADQVLSALTGRTVKPWFRLPYGDGDAAVDGQVLEAGYRYLLGWTVDSLGWQGLSVAAITQRCLSRAEPGAIYLFHVGSRSHDAQALPVIIQGLRDQGYSFLSLADLPA